MSGNVAVQNLPPAVLDDQEGVKQFECQCGYSEKVKRDDRLAMIGKKCLPALTVLAGPGPQTSQISCDGAFRGYCQVEQRYAHRLKAANYHSVILGRKNGPLIN